MAVAGVADPGRVRHQQYRRARSAKRGYRDASHISGTRSDCCGGSARRGGTMADESPKAQISGGYVACVASALRSRRGDRSTFTRLAKGGPALLKFRAQASKMEGRAPRASRMAMLWFGPPRRPSSREMVTALLPGKLTSDH